MSNDYITEIANVLDVFFKGLTDCHVLTRYTVQLQVSEVDIPTIKRIKDLINEFIRKLQILCNKMPTTESQNHITENVLKNSLPTHRHLPSKDPQELITFHEPITFSTVSDEVKFTTGLPKTNLSGDLQDCFNNSNHSEKNYEVNESLNIEDKCNLVPKSINSLHHINKLKCILIPPDLEWRKKEYSYLTKDSLNSYNSISKTEENDFRKNVCDTADDSNLFNKEIIGQDLLIRDTQSNKDDAANVVHIIVETTDRPSLIINQSNYSQRAECEENDYNYIKCHKELVTLKDVKEHYQLSHESSESYKCSTCSKILVTNQEFKIHNAESHYNEEKLLDCNICNKTFSTKLGLTRHIDSHNGKKTAVCDICGKSFRRSDYLRTHSTIHLGKKRFACKICPKRFVLKTQLKHHEKTHTDIKDFMCDICNKGFSRKDKLKEHILRHLNIKKFQCDLCNKHYAENRDLKKHQTSHIKLK